MIWTGCDTTRTKIHGRETFGNNNFGSKKTIHFLQQQQRLTPPLNVLSAVKMEIWSKTDPKTRPIHSETTVFWGKKNGTPIIQMAEFNIDEQ